MYKVHGRLVKIKVGMVGLTPYIIMCPYLHGCWGVVYLCMFMLLPFCDPYTCYRF